ncbi:MAG: hypothetical protein OEU62_02225 [Gammaproteobacteria bacterium]|nr:hypothetical protein [Gammaproteobacteria bacterium]
MNILALFQAFIAYIDSTATLAYQKMLFYRERACFTKVSGTFNAGMVQHLAYAQPLDPFDNISSTATPVVAATNDTDQHNHANRTQHYEQHHVL